MDIVCAILLFHVYYSAAALLAMQRAVIPTAISSVCQYVCPSVCLSVTRWYPIHSKRMKVGSCGLYCEVAKSLGLRHQEWLGG